MKPQYLFVVVLFLLAGANARAADNFTPADFLVEIGEYELSQGRLDGAIHEFSKALLLDPDHPRAKEYLAKYGMQEGMYGGAQTQMTQMGRMARTLDAQRKHIAGVEMDKSAVEAELEKAASQRDNISKELSEKNLELYDTKKQLGRLAKRADKFDRQVKQIEKVYQQSVADIELEALFKDEPYELTAEQLGRMHAYENELLALQQEYNTYREMNFMDRVKTEAAYTAMADYVLVKSHVVDDLKDEVLYRDMDVAAKDSYLIEKINRLEDSLEEISHLRAQADFKDAMLKEKEDDLERLRKELRQFSNETEARINSIRAKNPQVSRAKHEMERLRSYN